jgi:cell division protein FtsL
MVLVLLILNDTYRYITEKVVYLTRLVAFNIFYLYCIDLALNIYNVLIFITEIFERIYIMYDIKKCIQMLVLKVNLFVIKNHILLFDGKKTKQYGMQ